MLALFSVPVPAPAPSVYRHFVYSWLQSLDYDLLPLGLAYLLQAKLAVAMCRWHFHWLVDCILDLHRHLLLMPLAFWSIALRSVVLLLRRSTHLQDFEGLHLHRHHPFLFLLDQQALQHEDPYPDV